MIKTAFINSDDRIYSIDRCLSLMKTDIITGLRAAKNVVLKPNCVTDNNQSACTHVEALATILEFIRPHIKGQIVLAEGTGLGDTLRAFKNYHYFKLQDLYDLEIVDLNNDQYETMELIDKNGEPLEVEIASTLLASDYIISVSLPKAHDSVVYTGVIKNAAVGCLRRPNQASQGIILNKIGQFFGGTPNFKAAIHQGPVAINENIVRIYKKLKIGLAVLDGFTIMQGNGPINGESIQGNFAIASTDPIVADWLACQYLGFDTKDIGYLSKLLTDYPPDFFITGDDWQKSKKSIKMHPNFEKIRHWQKE
jgi:uncharacterized protein (DUF362 family)